MILRVLQPSDDRSTFHCGDLDCDEFIHAYAAQNQFVHRISTTLVIVEEEQVVGYATFSVAEMSRDDLPADQGKRLPRYPLPALRLGRLAVDERFQGVGLGSRLVREVLETALRLRRDLGCAAVLADAIPSRVGFYESLGFEVSHTLLGRSRLPGTVLMLLPLADVEAARSK